MPVHTRFSHLSDVEFERELEHRAIQSGQLVLGAELTLELMKRIREWIEVTQKWRKYR